MSSAKCLFSNSVSQSIFIIIFFFQNAHKTTSNYCSTCDMKFSNYRELKQHYHASTHIKVRLTVKMFLLIHSLYYYYHYHYYQNMQENTKNNTLKQWSQNYWENKWVFRAVLNAGREDEQWSHPHIFSNILIFCLFGTKSLNHI